MQLIWSILSILLFALHPVEQAASRAPVAFWKLNWSSAGRIQSEFMAPTNHPFIPPSRTNTYDRDDHLASCDGQAIYFDGNGNLNYAPLLSTNFEWHTFDARNRLLDVGGVSYGYDPQNNRTSATNGTNAALFVVDPQSSQVLMRVKNGVTSYYVYGLGLVYEEDDTASGSSTLTYHHDYRGSTVALTDANGNVTDRIEYSAYGMTSYRAGTNDTPFLYNGRLGVQTDDNGLLYMRARYYNPYLCRFINPDPSGLSAGLNLFAFANGNPISMNDPFGLGAKEAAMGDRIATWFKHRVLKGRWNREMITMAHPFPRPFRTGWFIWRPQPDTSCLANLLHFPRARNAAFATEGKPPFPALLR